MSYEITCLDHCFDVWFYIILFFHLIGKHLIRLYDSRNRCMNFHSLDKFCFVLRVLKKNKAFVIKNYKRKRAFLTSSSRCVCVESLELCRKS